ncbi:MAG: mechanosensitive ion channel [Candidatus Latescibacteria bacterium]|jgi:miniconductance mechanosensitive channel|nr:mechanosensitive ion channel [Candidatus Latescibacterota bacterium]
MLEFIYNWLIGLGVGSEIAVDWVAPLLVGLGILLLSAVADFLVKRIALRTLKYVIARTRTLWDDAIVEHHVLDRLAHLAPALVIFNLAELPFAEMTAADRDFYVAIIQGIVQIFVLIIGVRVVDALLNAALTVYRTFEVSREVPGKGFVQVLKVLTYFVGGISILSILLDRNPMYFLSGLGALTAVLLLVFKDTILGLVAGVQLSANKMVAVGDWIEMPKYGADGDVIEVALTTVKVQNWDKTVTTIPAYALISDSFKNWRGMQESGGRRIKRSVSIDVQTIVFCDEEMLGRFAKIKYIAEYIQKKKDELARFNQELKVDDSSLVNGRRMTNVGTFRAYVVAYLKHHPKIHQEMTFLVRQLAPSENGLPIEVYVFSNDKVWANYEAIQADIFDHILAVVPEFDLRVFQVPTGNDFRRLQS